MIDKEWLAQGSQVSGVTDTPWLTQVAMDALATYGPKIVIGVLTFFVGWIGAKLARAGIRRMLRSARVDATVSVFCVNLAYVAILTLVVITALNNVGFPAVSFAAVVGAAGLAVGLALKGTLSNFASGVILISLRPFNVGDRIDAAGVSGVVNRIQVFATTIDSTDGKKIIIPNASLTGGNITNHAGATGSKQTA